MLLLLSFSVGLAFMQPCAAAPFQWEFTGSLNTAREYQAATLLPDGRVLVAGGGGPSTGDYPFPRLKSAELYNPATGTWTVTGSLNDERELQTQTLLPNGKVLAAGGWPEGTSTGTAELYDPATETWTFTGSLNARRAGHTATLLLDGRVLAVGGSHSIHSAELYDPATGTFTVTGSLNTGRQGHTAMLLPNGKVLVAGGLNRDIGVLASAELYDPATGNWRPTGNLNVGRWYHTGTLLSDSRVLVAGGWGGQGPNSTLASAEIYDPATGTWTFTSDLNNARARYTATLLSDGIVLVAGGNDHGSIIATAELFLGPLRFRQPGK